MNQTEMVVEIDALVPGIDGSARVIVESGGRGNAAKGNKRNQVQPVRALIKMAKLKPTFARLTASNSVSVGALQFLSLPAFQW